MMGDHRTVSLGLMGKYFSKLGKGQIIVGSADTINLEIETPQIDISLETTDINLEITCD